MPTVAIEALVRFNQHDPGEVFEAGEADAEKWIKNGLAKKPGKKSDPDPAEDPEEKGTDAPSEDKAKKEAPKKK